MQNNFCIIYFTLSKHFYSRIVQLRKNTYHFCDFLFLFFTSVIFWSLIYSPVKVAQSCPTLCNTMTVAHQALLFTRVSRQEYWSG